jgi:hypothetical protein
MPAIDQTPAPSATFGPCSKCQGTMRLALIEPDLGSNLAYETRIFRCDACGHSDSKRVKYR